MAMMATNKTVKFLIDQQDWENFVSACDSRGTYPSEVLRELCSKYAKRKRKSKVNGLDTADSLYPAYNLDLFMNPKKTKKIRTQSLGELYAGPGGIGLGAALARLETPENLWITEPSWMNDYCSDTCDSWEKNVLGYERKYKNFKGSVEILKGDVREIDIEKLPDIDGLMFGFPCNDFSIVGEKKGFDGNFGPLYSYGVKVLRKKNQPAWFLAENVGGITSSNEGKAFEKILSDLEESGYRITAHKYKLEEYSIPQARHRIMIVGFRNDLNLSFKVPAPHTEVVTAGDALSLPIPPGTKNVELTKQSSTVVERLSYIDPGENCWNAKRLPDRLQLNVPRTRLSHIYKKIDPNKPSYTVTGSGGGGTHMYHWAENRALTNRERARLQTFPDWFEFCGSKESVRKQIGMAIPVLAGKEIIEAILKTLANEPYDYIDSNIN